MKTLNFTFNWWCRRRHWHPTPVLLPGESHGWRSLVGCSPWGRWGSGTTEQLHFHFSLSCIGEGNGNPLQCSCLENPRDSGAWWAAAYGVAQGRTQLKWLSSSRAHLLYQAFYFLDEKSKTHRMKEHPKTHTNHWHTQYELTNKLSAMHSLQFLNKTLSAYTKLPPTSILKTVENLKWPR